MLDTEKGTKARPNCWFQTALIALFWQHKAAIMLTQQSTQEFMQGRGNPQVA